MLAALARLALPHLPHPRFHLGGLARQPGRQVLVARGGDQHVVLDADADAAVLRGHREIVALEVQARLLARHSPEEIARITPLPAEAVATYEALFFNVVDRLDARDWITAVAIDWWRFDPATGERIEAQGTIRDVDARKRAELRLANRIELEKLILNASSAFLELGTEQVDTKIDETLGRIGNFLNADRAFVIRIDPTTGRLHAPNRWTLSTDDVEPSVLERAPSTVTARWLLRLAHNELVQIDDSTESPRQDELVVLASRGVRAVMFLPMRTLTNLVGVLVFESTSRAQSLDDDQITLLRIVVELFTNAIELRRRSDELRQSEERFRLLALNSSDLIARIDVDGYLRYVSPVVRSLLGYVPEDLVGTRFYEPTDRGFIHSLASAVGSRASTLGAVSERIGRLGHRVVPAENDGQTVHRLAVRDAPVDGFWSISVYNARGFFEKNALDSYSLNNLTAKRNKDGSVTVQFGGCSAQSVNCLVTPPGWNYVVRQYRPRRQILDGTWHFPEATPVQ
jgi:GAF domain-containing protein